MPPLEVPILLGVVTLLTLLPFLPGYFVWRRKRDVRPLHIDSDYVRDPRFFGTNFRRGILPKIAAAAPSALPGPPAGRQGLPGGRTPRTVDPVVRPDVVGATRGPAWPPRGTQRAETAHTPADSGSTRRAAWPPRSTATFDDTDSAQPPSSTQRPAWPPTREESTVVVPFRKRGSAWPPARDDQPPQDDEPKPPADEASSPAPPPEETPPEPAVVPRKPAAEPSRARKGFGDDVEVHGTLHIKGRAGKKTLVSLEDARVEPGSVLTRLYVRRNAIIGARTRLGCVAVDGTLTLEEGCKVEQWIDCEGNVAVGPRCDLGLSASSAGQMLLGTGSEFQRLWANPVIVAPCGDTILPAIMTDDAARIADKAARAQAASPGKIENQVLWASGPRLTLPPRTVLESDIVTRCDLSIGAGAVVNGSIKVHGNLEIGPGAQVEGSIICRQNVRLLGNVRIAGNVFAEGDVWVGPGCRVGEPHHYKSIYSCRRMCLMSDCTVYGWIFAGHGGILGAQTQSSMTPMRKKKKLFPF